MKFSIQEKVKFSEIGEDQCLSYGTMIDYLQNCSTCQSEALGIGVEYQVETKRAWLLNSWDIEINRPIKLEENLIVTTWAYEFTGALGRRNFTIADADNKDDFIVKANSVWMMYDFQTKRLTRLNEDDTKKYELSEKLDMKYEKSKIKRVKLYEQKDINIVRRYHLDINKHMNNAWYVKIAEEYINRDKFVHSIRVEYKKAAKYADTVIPFVAELTDRCVVELRNEENEVYAIVEFGY